MTTSVSACRRRARIPLAVAIAVLLSAPALAAQQRAPAPPQRREESRECRCTDGQGRDVERCVCVMGRPGADGFGAWAGGPWELPVGPMGEARRAVLGVGISTQQGDEYDARGARLGAVEEGSGADDAGLQEGDVIVRVDGRSLLEPLDPEAEAELDEDGSLPVQRLLALLADREPGDAIDVEYLRDGATRRARVELRAPRRFFADRDVVLDGPYAAPFGGPPGARAGPRGRMLALSRLRGDECPAPARDHGPAFGLGRTCTAGAALIELNEGLAEYFSAGAGDVLVVDVAPENPLGLAAGDVVVAVGGRDVRGLEHALGMLRSYEDDEQVQVRVIRKGQTMELDGTLR